MLAQVDEQRNSRTKATMSAALEAWLRTYEAEETTLDGYRGYLRRTIEPALGSVPLAKVSAQVLEEFYAGLRRCRHRCRDGRGRACPAPIRPLVQMVTRRPRTTKASW